jgi:hypothetical protein
VRRTSHALTLVWLSPCSVQACVGARVRLSSSLHGCSTTRSASRGRASPKHSAWRAGMI